VAYVVFGMVNFSSAPRRDAVQRQADRSFAAAGFTPSSAVQASHGIEPGTTAFDYVHPADAEPGEMTPGTTYPSLRYAWQTPDFATKEAAEQAISAEMNKGQVVGGWFGSYDGGPLTIRKT
jgi:hypothetical protein